MAERNRCRVAHRREAPERDAAVAYTAVLVGDAGE
jgi:hypothetical protein